MLISDAERGVGCDREVEMVEGALNLAINSTKASPEFTEVLRDGIERDLGEMRNNDASDHHQDV